MLIILSGCSGAGKNTIINKLLSESDRFEFMPTFTTRAMREGEREGFPYQFTTKEDFERRIAQGEFYEYENVHGNYYGTNRRILQEKKQGGKILIKDIDVLGTLNLERKMLSDEKIITVFLDVSSKDELIKRLIGRGEKDIELRMRRYEMEISHAKDYQYIINNVEIDRTVNILNAIVDAEISGKAFEKADEYAESIESQSDVPVNLAYCGGRLLITSGYNDYLSALNSGTKIAKRID